MAGFEHRSLEEIATELEEMRERNMAKMDGFDFSLLDILIHDVREKSPNHNRAACPYCTYFDWDKEVAPNAE